MTEKSRPWSGTTPGDAGAYTDQMWADIWESLFGANQANKGVIALFGSDFSLSGVASPFTVGTGNAVANGRWYNSDASTSVAVPTPAVSTRVDRIVARVSWAAQTVRITRIAGVEGAGTPSLVQVDGTTWDIPLWKVSVTTGAVFTWTDEREFIWTSPLPFSAMGGRLTLTSGTPVTTSDVTGAGTIYYSHFVSDRVTLPTASSGTYGTGFASIKCTNNKSLSLTLTSGKNYDVLGYYDNGDLTLELSAAWTNDTTRADAITFVNGFWVKSSNYSRILLGTIRASGANTTEDSKAKRFVCNLFNTVKRKIAIPFVSFGSAAGYGYFAASSTYRVELVNCLDINSVYLHAIGYIGTSGTGTGGTPTAAIGVGLDTSAGFTGQAANERIDTGGRGSLDGDMDENCGIGFHYIAGVQYTLNMTCTFGASAIGHLVN